MTQKARPDAASDDGPSRLSVLTTPEQGWDERGIGPLVKTLEDGDADLRRSAALALGHIRDERVVAPLIKALRDPDREVRRWAMQGLGRSADPAAIPALINSLRETGEQERGASVAALTMIGPPAIPALTEALRRHSLDARCAAVLVLGGIADARSVGPLIAMLGAQELTLRMAAATALAGLATREPGLEVRAALPALRRLARQGQAAFYRRVIGSIERETAPTAHLPIPADGPAPSAEYLPIPSQSPPPDPDILPIPALLPPAGAIQSEAAPGWLRRLRQMFLALRPARGTRP